MTTTTTLNLTATTVVRCQIEGCHPHGSPGFLFAIDPSRTRLQMKCPRCGTSQVLDLTTLKLLS